jgi:hypothetical protein
MHTKQEAVRGRYRRNYGKEAYELKQKYPELSWTIIGERLGTSNPRGSALTYENQLKKTLREPQPCSSQAPE